VGVSTAFPEPARARSLRSPLATGLALGAAAGYVALRDPAGGSVLPPCPFRTVTGWWCPGCGMTRAVHELAHLDLEAAIRLNALVLPVVALIAVAWTGSLLGALGRRPAWIASVARPPTAVVALAVAVAVGFAVVRNLPGVDALRG
jgi:hypothetical protein